MGSVRSGKGKPRDGTRNWPPWARRLASAAIVLHLAAVGSTALDRVPGSGELADLLSGYLNFVDLGYTYRYYERLDRTEEPREESRPWFTPVATARLTFADGREEEVRLPDPALRPRLRFQRHLALASYLYNDFRSAFDPVRRVQHESLLGRSYARHLCRSSGCVKVELFVQEHRIPDPLALRKGEADADGEYTVLELVGDYSCQASALAK